MSPRHKAPVATTPRHARFRRAQQLSWIFLGMLFVAAVLLSSPQLATTEPAGGTPSRDLAGYHH